MATKKPPQKTLTVGQLIERLQRWPSDLPVYVHDVDMREYTYVVDVGRNQDSRAPIGIHLAVDRE